MADHDPPDELAACPFCGSPAKVEHMGREDYISCSRPMCAAEDLHAPGAAAWNRRASPAQVTPSAEARELEWLRGQIVALCEDTERQFDATTDDANDHARGYARGRIKEAKSIRNAICEVVRDRLAFIERPG